VETRLHREQLAVVKSAAVTAPGYGLKRRGKDLPAIGERIRERRLERKLSQRDIEQISGLSYAYVSRVEMGLRSATWEALVALGSALDATGLELLTGNVHAHCPFCDRG
jgi:Helix-turn-helix domain